MEQVGGTAQLGTGVVVTMSVSVETVVDATVSVSVNVATEEIVAESVSTTVNEETSVTSLVVVIYDVAVIVWKTLSIWVAVTWSTIVEVAVTATVS
jgi:hypothetical protein